MEKPGSQEILNTLNLYSLHMDEKLKSMEDGLNARMDKAKVKFEDRFDRFGKKLDVFRIDLQET
ncbi:hypothetical protein KHA96_15005 [Bacillus sp. FJAT-49711]|uniref:hypothetical protein n=1 Tax=Bacillus sp. FJAT-49711 TaxID=2833585 RepID=UPI001BC949C4|nr:hypothetical protein [Bacillus sp. FJAT-49711]MBS4219623.1 hypothetical protein [Bacillus sp. FJAT-49711]